MRPAFNNTKIIATVGPASESREMLEALAFAGVDVFRLNFSHGVHPEKGAVIQHILDINEEHGLHIGILADLQGPKIRIGEMEGEGLMLEAGDVLTITNEECLGNKERIYMSYTNFANDVKVGARVLIDDGKIICTVKSIDKKNHIVLLEVVYGGLLTSNKGVNLPYTNVSIPALTEKDRADLDFILGFPVNWIALSFVRSAKEIELLRGLIQAKEHHAKIIAKVEKPEAVDNIDDIIEATDAVMVARGDLGVEVPMEKLPLIQKDITQKCIEKARPVIIATQMMESMIENPSPTRAEITDVANAVMDGADAVMLSGETSIGKHPLRVIKAVESIVNEVEAHSAIFHKGLSASPSSNTYLSDAVCFNACKIAKEVSAKAITAMTVSGYTAFKISSCRPKSEIFIFSERRYILSTLSLIWGIRSYHYKKFTTTDETIEDVNNILQKEKFVSPGDVIINTGSMPIQSRSRTNMLRITVIDD